MFTGKYVPPWGDGDLGRGGREKCERKKKKGKNKGKLKK
jgi:hypothetical protein